MRRAREPRYVRETEALVRRDGVLREIVRRVGPCTLAPSNDHFLTLAEAIIWQQLSWRAACSIHARFLQALGGPRPGPADVARAPDETLAGAGVSRQKIKYLRELAAFFAENRFPSRSIRRLSDDDIARLLTGIKGIGPWTVDMYLIFGLNRLDVFPAGDLGLVKSIAARYGGGGARGGARVESVTEKWRPYRTIGAWYLWAAADTVPLAAASGKGEE